MKIKIQSKGGTPIYTQISNQIKEAILTGQLQKGEALPSIRGLSADLKISVITTKKAYEELEQEGLSCGEANGYDRGGAGRLDCKGEGGRPWQRRSLRYDRDTLGGYR